MKQGVWIVAACVGSWLLAAVAFGYALELFLGMLGPAVASVATWLAIERAHRQDPARVSAVMMRAFGLKMLFFGAYVVVITRLWPLEFAPFAASFGLYFLGLQTVKATLLRGLTIPQASRPH